MGNIKAMAVLLIVVLAGRPFCAAAQTAGEKKVTIKERVVMIPTGSIIEVKLLQKGSSKIKGKLGSITDEGFEVQSVKSGKVSSEQVAFADVKSVKAKRGMSGTTKVLLVAGVVLLVSGVSALALIIAATVRLSN